MKTNKHLLQACTTCGNKDEWIILETTNLNHHIVYPYYCLNCWKRSPIVEKKSIAQEVGYEPILE